MYELIFSYLITGTIIVFFINYYLINFKKIDYVKTPFFIVSFFIVNNLINYKEWFLVLFSILFFPLINIYIFYFNFLKNKKFLCNKNDMDYNLTFSDKTLIELKKILEINKIEFNNKYLNNNLKFVFISSLRKYVPYIETEKIDLNTELFSIHLNYFFQTGKTLDLYYLIELLEKDYKDYLKNFPDLDTVYDNGSIYVKFKDELFIKKSTTNSNYKSFERETIVFN